MAAAADPRIRVGGMAFGNGVLMRGRLRRVRRLVDLEAGLRD
jgi:hypothetical protein